MNKDIIETISANLVTRTHDFVCNLIKANPKNTESMAATEIQIFENMLDDYVLKLNIAWMPSTNLFHPVTNIDTRNRVMTIDDETKYDCVNTRYRILDWGSNYFTNNLLEIILDSIDDDSDSEEAIIINHILYLSFAGTMLFEFARMHLFRNPSNFQIPLDDPMAYIFISYQLNSCWNYIVNNFDLEKCEDTEARILYLKPTIAFEPGDKFTLILKDLDLVDVTSILRSEK